MTGPRGATSGRSSFVVDVAKLRERLGSSVSLEVDGEVDAVETSTAELVDGQARLVVMLEAAVGGVTARGVASGRFRGACRRCLEPVEGDYAAELDEVFEDAPDPEGETYPIVDQRVDLGLLVRDALLLALPLAPTLRRGVRRARPRTVPRGRRGCRASDARPPLGRPRRPVVRLIASHRCSFLEVNRRPDPISERQEQGGCRAASPAR